jgi:hypothetical protein
MTIPVACPFCKRRLHVPEKYAGRKITCPRCGEAVRALLPDESPKDAPIHASAAKPAVAQATEAAPLSTRLGLAALILGLLAIMILCVPVFGYASLGLSGIGILLGVSGLLCARKDGMRRVAPPAGEAQGQHALGGSDLSYALAGTMVCLLAAALVLLPFLLR